jgi:hypothetical protein
VANSAVTGTSKEQSDVARAKSVPDHLGAHVKFEPDQADTGIGVGSFAVKEMPNGKWAIYHRNTGLRVSVAKNETLAEVAAATLARKGDDGAEPVRRRGQGTAAGGRQAQQRRHGRHRADVQ